jgi:protein TonB
MTGVVLMRFSVDAVGHIVSASMVRSSGHDELDEEAEAWLRRAQPLPPPPSDRVAPAQLVVPLQFVLH